MSNLDSLLDGSIDAIADLPEFKVYPAGAHKVTVEFTEKKVNDKDAVELKMVAIETVELTDPTNSVALQPGDESSVLFQLDNEFGQGKFKNIIKVLAAHFNVSSARAAMEQAKGMEVVVLTKVRTAKNDKDTKYTEVVELMVE